MTRLIQGDAESPKAEPAGETSEALTRWFAVRVKSNRENIVFTHLSMRGYETLLPRYALPSTERARVKQRALFPGYVFCRFDISERLPVLMLPAVVHIVGIGRTPVPIEDEEIESLRLTLDSRLPVHPVDYIVGECVRITSGPLVGAIGVVTGSKKQQFVVSITLLQRSIAVKLRPDWIAPIYRIT
jgi:transcriptional antiterminator NusG